VPDGQSGGKSVKSVSDSYGRVSWLTLDHSAGKAKLILGILSALAMMFLTFTLARGGALRDAALVQFPVTVGVWAIFVETEIAPSSRSVPVTHTFGQVGQ